jgi:hypothetical protein
MTGNAKIGTTLGYDASGGGFLGDYLFVDYAVRTWALTPDLALGPLRAQVGPAFFRANSWRDNGGAAAEQRGQSKLGWVVGGAWSGRAIGPLRLEARVQYRAVGRAAIGPFGSFPEVQADFSHWFGGLGIGLHF